MCCLSGAVFRLGFPSCALVSGPKLLDHRIAIKMPITEVLRFGQVKTETMKTTTSTTKDQTTETPCRRTAPPRRRGDKGPRIRPLGDLLNDETINPRQQLCGPWLLERGFSMVFAPTGVGKSWFAMGVAAAVAGGGSFGHWSAREPRRVLYIDGEMDMSDLKGRFQGIIGAALNGRAELIGQNVILYARHDQPEGDTSFPDFGSEDYTERILQRIRTVRPDLVILDNLSTLATVDDTNAASAWDPFLKLLQRIRGTGAAVLVVHHANKGGETYNGSSKIPVMFDALVRLRPRTVAFDQAGAAFMLDFVKTRMLTEDARRTFTVAFSGDGWAWDTLVSPEVSDLVRRILDGEFRTQAEAGTALSKSKGEVSKMLGKAYEAGITTREDVAKALAAAKEADDGVGASNNDF